MYKFSIGEAKKIFSNKKIIILIFLLLALYVTVPNHISYPLPLHGDEYDNLAEANEIIKQQTGIQYDPFTPPEGKSVYYARTKEFPFQLLFSFLLISLILLTGLDTLGIIIALPFLFSLLMMFGTFLLVRQITKSEKAAFFAALFTLLLKSNITLLGYQLVVASSFGLAIMPMLLYLFLKIFDSKKMLAVFLLLLMPVFLAYAIALVSVLFIIIVFFVSSPRFLIENKKKIIAMLLLALAVYYILIFFIGQFFYNFDLFTVFQDLGPFILIPALFGPIKMFFFKAADLSVSIDLISYLSVPVIALGLIGIVFSMRNSSANKNYMIFPISVLIFFSLTIFSLFTGNYILIPYRRAINIFSFFFLISAGIGFYFVASYVARNFEEYFKEALGTKAYAAKYFFLLILGIFLGYALLTFPFELNPQFTHYIEPNQLPAIEWLNSNTEPDDIILSLSDFSKAVGLLTGRKVICTTETKFGCRAEYQLLNLQYFFADCENQERILTQYFQADYVVKLDSLELKEKIVEFPDLNCLFLTEEFSQNGIKIYKVHLERSPSDIAFYTQSAGCFS